jgi:hypothetical protein
MKNVTYVGLCWAMCFSLVAVALGQQYAPPGAPAAGQPAIGQPAAPAQGGLFDRGGQAAGISQPAYGDQRQAMPAPGTPMERSQLSGTDSQDRSMLSDARPRAELGVWLVESAGPGVEIQRVTPGSAAEQAGLRIGDIVLQVNGKGAATPQETARLIREIPIGQRGTLTVWRDGNQQQLPITLQAARERVREMIGNVMRDESHEVGFRGDEARGGDSSRITRLEEKIATLTQQLNAMQQELTTLRSQQGGTQRASYNESAHSASSTDATSTSPLPPAASPAAPPPGFGEEKKDAAPPAAAPPASEPAATPPATTPPPPAADKPATDPFGAAAPAPATEPPKAEEKKAEEKKQESKDATDDLFK